MDAPFKGGSTVSEKGALRYHYTFTFGDGVVKEFDILLDPTTLNMPPRTGAAPEWASLEYSQCKKCPLDTSVTKYCPIASNIAGLVQSFDGMLSYSEVEVSVITEERNTWKHTSVQEGVSSMLGIYMVTSGCPVMEKLKPMVRYHLPFATLDETTYRATAMYLLAQYFRQKQGMEPDWQLQGLASIYENVQGVNEGMAARIRNASRVDAGVNALVALDAFAQVVPFFIEDELTKIEYLFAAYID